MYSFQTYLHFVKWIFKILVPVYILTDSVLKSMFFLYPGQYYFYIFKFDRWIMEFCYFNFHFLISCGVGFFFNVFIIYCFVWIASLCHLHVFLLALLGSRVGWRAYFLSALYVSNTNFTVRGWYFFVICLFSLFNVFLFNGGSHKSILLHFLYILEVCVEFRKIFSL